MLSVTFSALIFAFNIAMLLAAFPAKSLKAFSSPDHHSSSAVPRYPRLPGCSAPAGSAQQRNIILFRQSLAAILAENVIFVVR